MPLAIYKYAAPKGLGKATFALNSMAASHLNVNGVLSIDTNLVLQMVRSARYVRPCPHL
jgi:hypothetical protein